MRFNDLKEPTTVTNVRYAKDTHGRQFSEKYKDMQVVGSVSKYQEKRIRDFLNEDRIKTFRNKGKRD